MKKIRYLEAILSILFVSLLLFYNIDRKSAPENEKLENHGEEKQEAAEKNGEKKDAELKKEKREDDNIDAEVKDMTDNNVYEQETEENLPEDFIMFSTLYLVERNVMVGIDGPQLYRLERTGDNTTKKNREGHGLGLRIVENIVNRYDGQIIIEDEDNYFKVKILLYGIGK